jgi:hypothetical protein
MDLRPRRRQEASGADDVPCTTSNAWRGACIASHQLSEGTESSAGRCSGCPWSTPGPSLLPFTEGDDPGSCEERGARLEYGPV